MDAEQQRRYQLETLGIERVDVISQNHCCDYHGDLIAPVLTRPPKSAYVEVTAWKDFEINDPNPDQGCNGLDRIAGGNLHRARILRNVVNQTDQRGSGIEAELKTKRKTKHGGRNRDLLNSKSTPNQSRFAISRKAALPVPDQTTPQSQTRPFIDHPSANGPIGQVGRSQVFGSRVAQDLSEPDDFMAAIGKVPFTITNNPTSAVDSETVPFWSAIQDLIDLDFISADQSDMSTVSSSTMFQEARHMHLASELSTSSNITSVTTADQSFSSTSSDIERHEAMKLRHDCSSRIYDAKFLKRFSGIKTLHSPFHPDTAPIVKSQAQTCLPSEPLISLSNPSLSDTGFEARTLSQTSFDGLQLLGARSYGSANGFDGNGYPPNQLSKNKAFQGNIMDSKYAH